MLVARRASGPPRRKAMRKASRTRSPPPGPDLSRSRRVTGSAPPRRGDAATGRAPMPGSARARPGRPRASTLHRSDRPLSPLPGRVRTTLRRGADRRVHMQHKLSLAKRQAEEKPTAAPYGAHTLSQLEDEVLAGHTQSAILECRAVRDSVSALRLSARRHVTDCTKAILQRRFGQRRGRPVRAGCARRERAVSQQSLSGRGSLLECSPVSGENSRRGACCCAVIGGLHLGQC